MKIQASYVEERDGNLYAGESRVTVKAIVGVYKAHGYTPAELHDAFPTVPLSTIYGVLAYYFDHQQELDEAFARQHAIADQMRQAQRNNPNHPANIVRRRIEEARKQNEGWDEINSR